MPELLTVSDLRVTLPTADGPVEALRGISLSLAAGSRLGLIGESGSGKTLTALAVMGLLPEGAVVSGSIRLAGDELVGLDDRAMARRRGSRMAMVFQEPMTALNPLHRVGDQVAEGLRLHRGLSRSAARAETLRLLDRVRLPQAASRVDAYPHQLSGGQRQRVLLAIALACAPALLIADEATTALDPGLQREVLDLLMSFVVDDAMGLVLISHDLALMAERSDTLLVMYAGCIVESGPTRDVLAMRAHPYTQGLFRSRARLDLPPRTRLPTIPGRVPALGRAGPGCPFADRCALVDADCRIALPAAVSVGPSHRARCIRIDAAHTHRAGAETSPVQEGT